MVSKVLRMRTTFQCRKKKKKRSPSIVVSYLMTETIHKNKTFLMHNCNCVKMNIVIATEPGAVNEIEQEVALPQSHKRGIKKRGDH